MKNEKFYTISITYRNAQGILFQKTKGTLNKELAVEHYERAKKNFPKIHKLISLKLNEGTLTTSN